MRAFQWIQTWQGLDCFQNSFHTKSCALDENSLSIGRVKTLCCEWIPQHIVNGDGSLYFMGKCCHLDFWPILRVTAFIGQPDWYCTRFIACKNCNADFVKYLISYIIVLTSIIACKVWLNILFILLSLCICSIFIVFQFTYSILNMWCVVCSCPCLHDMTNKYTIRYNWWCHFIVSGIYLICPLSSIVNISAVLL